MVPHTEHNLSVALALASAGLPIFPAIVTWDESEKKYKKKPAIEGWQAKASTDPEQIDAWWQKTPHALPGVELGRAGLLAIDLDRHPGKRDGVSVFKEIRNGRDLPPHPATKTASGGFHLILGQPDGEPLGNGPGNLPNDCIDIRGAGGWVVAPGAKHPHGGAWQSLNGSLDLGHAYASGAIPTTPQWLLDELRPPRRQHNGSQYHGPREGDEALAVDALSHVPADSYYEWFRMAAILKERFGEQGKPIWIQWASKSGKFSEHEQGPQWDAIKKKYYGFGTLLYTASLYGWAPPHHQTNGSAGYTTSSAEPEKTAWPQMDGAAYQGLAGEVVAAIAPHSEADPVALLIQCLTMAGNIMGRTAYWRVENDMHRGNLFAVLVGESAKARKGTSLGHARAIARHADKQWDLDRIQSGLSSGEGLINAVRDPRMEWDKKNQVEVVADPGVADKRLLVIEPEFASVLAVTGRQGNTLSQLIRRAWDGDKLSTMTKHSPLCATGAHISLVGHITVTELRATLTRTEAASGFANRFLYLLVRRSQKLPFGGAVDDGKLAEIGERLQGRISLAANIGRVDMTPEAREQWAAVYNELSEGRPGLLGAVIARAEAQVVRLALTYALLDGCAAIDVPHLRAAIAVWEYAEASAAFVFGDMLGDPIADEILRALLGAGGRGMTRTAISNLFGRHCSADRLSAALALLVTKHLARSEATATGGRPTETWYATGGQANG